MAGATWRNANATQAAVSSAPTLSTKRNTTIAASEATTRPPNRRSLYDCVKRSRSRRRARASRSAWVQKRRESG